MLNDKEGEKLLKRTIVVFELPFVAEEKQIREFFEKVSGGISSIDVIKANALVFSSAVIQFNKEKGAEKAIELARHGVAVGQFDGIVCTAQDVIEGKKLSRTAPKEEGKANAGGCKNQ
ncbi:predicted protein [Naegleria gruberi]|uniref:Predicted protein n=1 Tax=Naegleria gruberi TaxID=5762 RepID=D2VU00_NAEGR|nr:uncharacterized protein NAEGRDRAFT_52240 [Naegleria gruberi]EFC39809.1 predicted protein [Naegleria gruberi]|eukprot:XP_002672553.1 predicted protein [Naegleria gruberi strain NEG-M]